MGCVNSKQITTKIHRKYSKDDIKEIDKMHDFDERFERIRDIDSGIFGMTNYYDAESYFGACPGVIRTRVGFRVPVNDLEGDNLVEIEFDRTKLKYGQLLAAYWNHRISKEPSAIIFYNSPDQKKFAFESVVEHLLGREANKVEAKYDYLVQKFSLLAVDEFEETNKSEQKFFLQNNSIFPLLGIEPGHHLARSHIATRLNGFIHGHGTMSQLDKEIQSGELYLSPNLERALRYEMKLVTGKPVKVIAYNSKSRASVG